ncbi:pectinesterase-like [Gossypium australe]|uniref:Pectinesterase-like n=1 Tax=Gossypium australe TaxID=47621 RepID=A0A5B6W0N3_9ROSI|nr:pectinesterase-like [Gossypium australe]
MLFEGNDNVSCEKTLYYAKCSNCSPGANLNVRGYHKINRAIAMKFTIQSFLLSIENWLLLIDIPFTIALGY